MRPLILALLTALALAPRAHALSDDAILDSLQYTAFQYMWNEANPANGLIKDRSTSTSPASIAAVGFGLSGICIGADHGWVTRPAAASRVLTTLQTFWTWPQGSQASGTIGYKGLYYHFLDMNTGYRTWDCELSTIDTALLLAGIIDAKQYFTGGDSVETTIRALADSIYRRVDWVFTQNFNPGILMGWKPGTGFGGFGQWIGYNEAMILYLLALGSPTHPVATTTWNTWTSGYSWQTQYGYTYVIFPPLFGHQYSHCWIDYRNIADAYMQGKGITYFENSRRATYAQRAYCISNPFARAGYSDSLWGLTACDDPVVGYQAHGAPPAQADNGTIAPTAPISSIPFAQEICLPVIRNLWNNYKAQMWGPYGFKDAFNLSYNWYATDVLGIDQGPILIMIENYRTGQPWARMMQDANIQTGLARAGFVTTQVGVDDGASGSGDIAFTAQNPVRGRAEIRYTLPSASPVRLVLLDAAGREVRLLVDGRQSAGPHATSLDARGLRAGVYRYRLEAGNRIVNRACVVLH
jgi:hypothetical protein